MFQNLFLFCFYNFRKMGNSVCIFNSWFLRVHFQQLITQRTFSTADYSEYILYRYWYWCVCGHRIKPGPWLVAYTTLYIPLSYCRLPKHVQEVVIVRNWQISPAKKLVLANCESCSFCKYLFIRKVTFSIISMIKWYSESVSEEDPRVHMAVLNIFSLMKKGLPLLCTISLMGQSHEKRDEKRYSTR